MHGEEVDGDESVDLYWGTGTLLAVNWSVILASCSTSSMKNWKMCSSCKYYIFLRDYSRRGSILAKLSMSAKRRATR